MLLLPGMGDRLGIFEKQGFQALAQRYATVMENVTIVELDAHFGYYPSGELLGRIKEDVMDVYPDLPVTVVGTSLGGFGAQLIARGFSDRVDHLILIAPYMGPRKVINRVAKEGPALRPGDKGRDREVLLNWSYLMNALETGHPRLDVLVGEADAMKRGLDMWEQRSPKLRVISMPGGHKWRIWIQLWETWLKEEADRLAKKKSP